MNAQDLIDKGYTIAQVPEIIPLVHRLRSEIYDVFNVIAEGAGEKPIRDDADVINFHVANQPRQYLAVKQLWCAPAIFALGGHEIFVAKLKALGFKRPILELQPLLRCDMPIKNQSIFGQHQDYAYNIGSENSVTVWIPLQDTSDKEGALLVAPGTHKEGVFPNKKGVITSDFKFDFISCPVNLGEVLIFNQKLVHESGVNTSDKIRFSVQLRFSDLGCSAYAARGFPINHKVTTEAFAGEI